MSGVPYQWGDRLPALAGQRVRLRGIQRDDVPALFGIFSDPEVMRYWSTPPWQEIAEAARLFDRIQEGFRSRELFQWGICQDEVLCGTCTLFHFDLVHRRAEIGYALAAPFWGKGLATDAVGTLIEFAFETLDLHRIEADVDPRNARSLALLARLGFCREGCLRERYMVNGEIQDALLLGLLRPEWSSGRGASR